MIKNVKVSDLAYVASKNYSRQSGEFFASPKDKETLVNSLVSDGWDLVRGMIVVTPLNGDADTAGAERDAAYAKLEPVTVGKVELSLADVQKGWEVTFPSKPKFRGLVGYRRFSVLPLVNALRIRDGKEPITSIPVDIREKITLQEEISLNISENTLRDVGSRDLGKADRMLAARSLYQSGATQKALRDVFKAGEGQRLYEICEIDKLAPSLCLVSDIVSGKLDMSGLNKEKLRKLKEAIQKGEVTLETVVARFTEDVIGAGHSKAEKIADRKAIQRLYDNTPVLFIKDILGAVLTNDLGKLSGYLDKHGDCNAAHSTIFPKA